MRPFALWVYPVILLATFLVSGILTPVALALAVKRDFLDHPGPAKGHAEPVPYLGGAAMVASFSVAVVCASIIHPPTRGLVSLGEVMAMGLLLAGLGLLDDLRTLPVAPRLVAEIGVAIGLWAVGIRLNLAGVGPLLDALLSIAFVVVVTNAFNLLDNIDGLAAGLAAMSALSLFAIAVLHGEFLVAALGVSLAGCALGFLWHNFHPARIYMGDAGSLFLGFMLSVLALKLRDHPPSAVNIASLVAVLGVALFDTGFVIVTRLMRKVSPFTGGQDHTSHRLVRLGMSVRGSVGILYLAATLLGGLGIAFSEFGPEIWLWGLVGLGVSGVSAGVLLERYSEPTS
jgi:UDP-GlcNAc:undecaprenyl-phosphate GlcNAc-1-phosphate transferase